MLSTFLIRELGRSSGLTKARYIKKRRDIEIYIDCTYKFKVF